MANVTLCWDCCRATGGCPWANELIPVKGWTAQKIHKTSSKPYDTYIVLDCPLFERDAVGGGLKRYKENKDEHKGDASDINLSNFADYRRRNCI